MYKIKSQIEPILWREAKGDKHIGNPEYVLKYVVYIIARTDIEANLYHPTEKKRCIS